MTDKRIRALGWVAVLILVCLSVKLSDSLLGLYKSRTGRNPYQTNQPLPYRALRLREWPPGFTMDVAPWEFEGTDSLVVKDYPLRVDQDGFIMPSRLHAAPDWTLVFLGGSTTECLFVDELKRFPYVVGRLLEEETGKKVNSFNGGKSGNDSFHTIAALLGKVIPLHPNAAIMMDTINNLSVLFWEKSYWSNNPTRSPLITIPPDDHLWLYYVLKGFKNLLIKHFYDEAWELINSTRKGPPDEFAEQRGLRQINEHSTAEILNEFRKSLELFIYICRLYDIVPVLMTQENRLTEIQQPIFHMELPPGATYTDFKHLYDSMNNVVREVGKDNGVVVIDLASLIPPTSEYLYDIVHFTEKGSMEAASIIAAELRKSVLVHGEGINSQP